ncbi:heavy metal-binding domain-containing protein [Streptomyces sp. NPDC056254]|uniref:heavy metal-binding domain-containing protein n=1 Tax=Streptomyces sp. NPDC056254 TaxID=3345763 RepID=UPI0035D936EF
MTRRHDAALPGSTGPWNSALPPEEFAAVRGVGFEPVGQVLGAAVFNIGYTGAWGADGIVGVRLDIEFKEFGSDIAEFIAVGTAVKAAGADPGPGRTWLNNKGRPFTSDLSGQDFWTLIRAGYAPLDLVMGSCVYHVAHQRLSQALGTAGRNVELEHLTQALYDARELAMSRMQAEGRALEAEGIVAVQLRQHSHAWGSHTTEFFAIGTAVRPLRDDHVIERPAMVLSLDA